MLCVLQDPSVLAGGHMFSLQLHMGSENCSAYRFLKLLPDT